MFAIYLIYYVIYTFYATPSVIFGTLAFIVGYAGLILYIIRAYA